jgi:hypothetical protein
VKSSSSIHVYLLLINFDRRTAICRGAIFKGFLEEQDNQSNANNAKAPIMVASTVARASYGTSFQIDYDAIIHLEQDKVWCSYEDRWKAGNQMQWYLNRVRTAIKARDTHTPSCLGNCQRN